MEPDQSPVAPDVTEVQGTTLTVKWYSPLCRVTKTSKLLAALTMIMLPFLGGYVGWEIAQSYSQQKTSIENIDKEDNAEVINLKSVNSAEVNDYRFEGRRTGYFNYQNRVFFTDVFANPNVEELANGESDWLFDISAAVELVDADSKTFEVIGREPAQAGSAFAKDSTTVFDGSKPLLKADPVSAMTFGRGGSYLISNEGLYLGGDFIVDGTLTTIEVFIQNDEVVSPYHVYVHQTDTNEWYRVGNVENRPFVEKINAPVASALGNQIFPVQIVQPQQSYNEDIKVTEDPLGLFNAYFVSAGDFKVGNVTQSAIYGRRLHFISDNLDIQLTGMAQVEFDYHYGTWITTFIPDENSVNRIPVLKDGQKVNFLTKTDDTLCRQEFGCKNVDEIINGDTVYTSPVYKTRVKIFNPTLAYEVIPSDAGTPAYTIGFDRLETISE